MTEISKEYAAALFEAAAEDAQTEAVAEALRALRAALAGEPQYIELLSAPNLPLKERLDLIEKAFSGNVPDVVLDFVGLLCKKGRLRLLENCTEEYEKLCRSFYGLSSARIVSVTELTQSEKEALLKKLEALTGHTVTAKYETDAAILGGLVVYIDNKIYDGSMRRSLRDLKDVIEQ